MIVPGTVANPMTLRIVDVVAGYGWIWGLLFRRLCHPEFEQWYTAGFAAAASGALVANEITKRSTGNSGASKAGILPYWPPAT